MTKERKSETEQFKSVAAIVQFINQNPAEAIDANWKESALEQTFKLAMLDNSLSLIDATTAVSLAINNASDTIFKANRGRKQFAGNLRKSISNGKAAFLELETIQELLIEQRVTAAGFKATDESATATDARNKLTEYRMSAIDSIADIRKSVSTLTAPVDANNPGCGLSKGKSAKDKTGNVIQSLPIWHGNFAYFSRLRNKEVRCHSAVADKNLSIHVPEDTESLLPYGIFTSDTQFVGDAAAALEKHMVSVFMEYSREPASWLKWSKATDQDEIAYMEYCSIAAAYAADQSLTESDRLGIADRYGMVIDANTCHVQTVYAIDDFELVEESDAK